MLFLMFFLLGVYASAAGSQDFGFVCGFEHRPSRAARATIQSNPVNFSFYQSGTVRPLILFGKLKSPDDPFSLTQLKDRNGNEVRSSADILNPDRVGSLAHYFKEMSYGALTLEDNDDRVERVWFEVDSTKVTDYGTACMPGVIDFAEEVFADADDTIDFSDYDRDDDGVVDLVILYIPIEFEKLKGCGFHGTVIEDYASSQNVFIRYPTADSVSIEGRVIVVFQRPSFPYLVGVAAHEYGHMMDLPELYDRGYDAAGIGSWGVMGGGPFGWSYNVKKNLFSGPNPLSVWSRVKVGWITEANGRLETVASDTTNATLHDIHSKSPTVKAYKIPIRGSDTEYFLMANRQNTYNGVPSSVGYYDDLAPTSGLAIWHIDDDGLPIAGSGLRYKGVNDNEKHKGVDLECADGLYDQGGFGTPGNSENSISGGDNLDYVSADTTDTKNNNGNLGDATDLWDGSTDYRHFSPSSNPSTAGYAGDQQKMFSGIAIRNITQNTNGSVSVDVHFIPSAPRDLGVAASGDQTQVTLAWSEPMVNKTAISGYQYSIDKTNWMGVDGGASARYVLFDNSTSTAFWVRAVTANNEEGRVAKIDLDRAGHIKVMAMAGDADALHTPPSVDNVLTATLTDANVPDDGWTDITVTWLWQRKLPAAKTWTDVVTVTATNTNTYMLDEEDEGHQVQVTATYSDETGTGSDMATSAPVTVNSRPEITTTEEATNPSVEEDSKKVIYTYMATDPDDGNMIKWSLEGTDASLFSIHATTGALTFEAGAAPDYEDPNTPNSYEVDVIASDGSLSATLPVTVTVKNVDEAGVVTVEPTIDRADGTTSPPRQGEQLTATLTDPDGGVRAISWQWQGQAPGTTTWQTLSSTSGSVQSSYTPPSAQVGWVLQAVVHYRDVLGAGERAESLPTAPVQGLPTAPENLTAADDDKSVTLTWEAPTSDGGTAITGYTYRYRAGDRAPWQPSDQGTTINDTTFYVRRMISGLTNGTAYTFEVWARNSVGNGASASVTATPAGVPAPPVVEATPLDGGVELTILLTADNGSKITHIEWRNSHINGQPLDPQPRWSGVSGFPGPYYQQLFRDGYSFDWSNLKGGDEYRFEVQVRNRQGASAIVSVTATPRVAPEVSVSFDSATYEAREGGTAAQVGVRLSAAAHRALIIPITITAADSAQRDYAVGGLTAGALWVAAGKQSQSFTLTAREDADSDDEPVTLSFGLLPKGVVAVGTARQATVWLRDNDNSPGTVSLSSRSPQVGNQLTATLTDPSGGITNTTWQWQRRESPTAAWTPAAGTPAQPRPWISTYTPQAGDGGDQLRATVGYTDADGANQQAESTATEAVNRPPTPAGDFSFVPPRKMESTTVGFQYVFNRPNPVNGTGTITYATTSTGGGLKATRTGISGTPTTAGSYDFTWTATDGVGNTALFTLTLTIRSPNDPPAFDEASIEYTVQAGSTVNKTLPAAEGADSYATAGTVPGYVTVNTTTRALSIQPENTHVGDASFTWRARNPHGTDSLTVNLTVTAIPTALPIPTGLTETVVDHDSARLNWNAVPGAGSYQARYRIEGSTDSWTTATTLQTFRDLSGLDAETKYEWAVRAMADDPDETNSDWGPSSFTTEPPPGRGTQYAYRAGQTAPLFDSAASGIPATWSSTAITWTHAAPRVWRIRRTRLSGGGWSAWGGLSIHSQRPAAAASFYQRASSAPATPLTQTGTNLATPRSWQPTQPTATATQGVWTTTATRAGGAIQWLFTPPTQETPPSTVPPPDPVRNLRAAGGSVAGSIAVSWDAPNTGGTPAGYRVEYRQGAAAWQAGGTTTQTRLSIGTLVGGSNYSIQVRAENSGGTSRWQSTTATATSTSPTTAPGPPRNFDADTGSPLTAGSIDLAWDAPTSGGTPTGYRVEYRFSSGSWLLGTTPTLTNASLVLSRAGARYQFRVRAENSEGNSHWVETTGTTSAQAPPPETQTAYRLHTSGTTAPTFTASASTMPTGWFSSRQTPTSSARYEWRITRTRPASGSWSSWGSATVVSTYTERQYAYQRNDSGTTAPAFSSTASGAPYGWSSTQPSPTSSKRYVWRISRTQPAGGSWSSWGSATVVSTYTERQYAYQRNDSGTTAPAFSSTASGAPYGWSSTQPSPTSSKRYVWRITRTQPAGGSWSSWGSATVVSTYTERQSAYRLHTSRTTAPTFSTSASGVPSGWSSSRRTTNPHERYEWRISRTRPTGGSWSNWGSATVVSTYTERQSAYRLHTSRTTAPTFTATASGVPSGWSSTRPTPDPYAPYVWRISRTQPTGGSWSNWGSATVVSTWTAATDRYRDGLKQLGPRYATDFRQGALVHPSRTLSRRTGSKYCLMNPQV